MKLLAAIDFEGSTPAVRREALLWARRLSAELFLVHVASPDPDFIGGGAGSEGARLAVAYKNQQARQRLEAYATQMRRDGVDAAAVLVQGPPAEMILQEADRLHADAILLGTYARGAANAMRIGSVAKQILFRAARPVVLVPPHDLAAS